MRRFTGCVPVDVLSVLSPSQRRFEREHFRRVCRLGQAKSLAHRRACGLGDVDENIPAGHVGVGRHPRLPYGIAGLAKSAEDRLDESGQQDRHRCVPVQVVRVCRGLFSGDWKGPVLTTILGTLMVHSDPILPCFCGGLSENKIHSSRDLPGCARSLSRRARRDSRIGMQESVFSMALELKSMDSPQFVDEIVSCR